MSSANVNASTVDWKSPKDSKPELLKKKALKRLSHKEDVKPIKEKMSAQTKLERLIIDAEELLEDVSESDAREAIEEAISKLRSINRFFLTYD